MTDAPPPFAPPTDAADYRRRVSAAAERNRDPILGVLRRIMPADGLVLEVASGTGEHAAYLAPRFPGLVWQPSDADAEMRESIAAWIAQTDAPNLRPPLDLDVMSAPWPVTGAVAVMAVNLIHISPWAACRGVMAGAARVLGAGGILYMYGPYRVDGAHTAPSNAAFDESLRHRNPEWGIRDVAEVAEVAHGHGLNLAETVAMPANNLSLIFRKD